MSRPGRRKTKRWKHKRAHAWRVMVNRVDNAIRAEILRVLSEPPTPYTDDGINILAEAIRRTIEEHGWEGRPVVPGSVRVEIPNPYEVKIQAREARHLDDVVVTGVVSV